MQEHHRLDNELSDSSDSESDQAEPIQVSRRRTVTTKKATQLLGDNTTEHTDELSDSSDNEWLPSGNTTDHTDELSDSSDSESDQAEPIQVLTKLRRRGVTTKKANRLPGGNTPKHTDLDNAKLTQPGPKDPPSHHDPQPTQPSRGNPSHQEHPELRQPSIKEYFNHREGLNHPPRAAPSNGKPKTPADFASLPRKRGATAANTGSDEHDQRLQDKGATSALVTSSTPTKKRRRVLDGESSSASENPPKRRRPDGHF